MGLHKKKTSFWNDFDSYLEKELVSKEEKLGLEEGKKANEKNK
tara:strand:+ start:208 stop:336 length:129 start_codon:yes stop_codon:yes gene_type:complete